MDKPEQAIKLLRDAAAILEERRKEYNGNGDMFERVSQLTGLDALVVFDVLLAVKTARLESAPNKRDSLLDYLGYSALRMTYSNPQAFPLPDLVPPLNNIMDAVTAKYSEGIIRYRYGEAGRTDGVDKLSSSGIVGLTEMMEKQRGSND